MTWVKFAITETMVIVDAVIIAKVTNPAILAAAQNLMTAAAALVALL